MLMQPGHNDLSQGHSGVRRLDMLALDLPTLLKLVRRRILSILLWVALALAIGAIYILTTTPLFTSTASILLDGRNTQVFDHGNRPSTYLDLGLDSPNVDSQVEIMQSEAVAVSVIKELGLQNDPEFTAPRNAIMGAVSSWIGSVISAIKPAAEDVRPQEDSISRAVIDGFQRRVGVKREGQTYLINLSFSSNDPNKAATIANALAAAYLNEGLNAKYASIKRGSEWLEARIQELRERVTNADRVVQRFKAENNIVLNETGGLNTEDQLANAANQITIKHSEVLALEARRARVQALITGNGTHTEVAESLDSDVINKLRDRYVQASARYAELSGRYGVQHEAVRRIQAEMRDLNRQILDQYAAAATVRLDDAKRAEADQRATYDRLAQQVSRENQARVQLKDLEIDANTSKTLYENFLNSYKAMTQQASFPVAEARVLSPATPPRTKSDPKTVLVLLLSLVGGGSLGLALALLRELTDDVFRMPTQIPPAFRAPCLGVLPEMKLTSEFLSASGRAGGDLNDVPRPLTLTRETVKYRYAVLNPFSRYTEALRAARIAIDYAAVNDSAKVIGITSSVPGEGKTTTSANIAQLIASTGKKVLLVDVDLRTCSLTNALSPGRSSGLAEYLAEGGSVTDAIYVDAETGVNFLPAMGVGSLQLSPEAISSDHMANFLSWARSTYDYVILDLPPLAPVVDVRAISPLVDGFIYIVEWGKTSINTVTYALETVPVLQERLLGVLLNRVDLKALRSYFKDAGNAYGNVYLLGRYYRGNN